MKALGFSRIQQVSLPCSDCKYVFGPCHRDHAMKERPASNDRSGDKFGIVSSQGFTYITVLKPYATMTVTKARLPTSQTLCAWFMAQGVTFRPETDRIGSRCFVGPCQTQQLSSACGTPTTKAQCCKGDSVTDF